MHHEQTCSSARSPQQRGEENPVYKGEKSPRRSTRGSAKEAVAKKPRKKRAPVIIHGEFIYGGAMTSEYKAWDSIKYRCFTPSSEGYHRYGARGITLCSGWRNYSAFLSDMGRKPSDEYSLDRIDNNGNYSCGHCEECVREGWTANCRWAVMKTQGRNRRNNRLEEIDGVKKCVSAWAEEYRMPVNVVLKRLHAGWLIQEALTKPVHIKERFIEFNGETKTIKEWAIHVGLTPSALYHRLSRKWDFEKAITTPQLNQ